MVGRVQLLVATDRSEVPLSLLAIGGHTPLEAICVPSIFQVHAVSFSHAKSLPPPLLP